MKKVSIIILTYNCLEEATKPCLESIYSCKNSLGFDVVVVDNFSTDGTREYLTEFGRTHKNFKVILNEENYGYAKGNNIGIQSVDADYYVLLNNDTIVTDCWLDKLVAFLENHPEVGMVGPVSNSVGNEQMIYIKSTSQNDVIAEGLEWANKCAGDFFYTSMLGFFCVAIRSDVIKRVGLFDERYGLGMFEDDDYCLRTVQEDYRLACLEDVFIYHKGGLSFNKLGSELNDLYYGNLVKFERKFNTKWKPRLNVDTFIHVIGNYCDSLNSENIAKIKDKISNRSEIMKGFDYAGKNLESLLLWQSCLQKDSYIEDMRKEFAEKDKELSEKDKELSEKGRELSEKDRALSEKDRALSEKDRALSEKDRALSEKDRVLIAKNDELTEKVNELKSQNLVLIEKDHQLNVARIELNNIHNSLFWKIASFIYRLVHKYVILKYAYLFSDSLRTDGLKATLIKVKNTIFKRNVGKPAAAGVSEHYNPYKYIQLLKDIEVKVIAFDCFQAIRSPFSVVTTIRNEEANIIAFLSSIVSQSAKPQELIIVDGGSTDDTIKIIENFIESTTLNIRLIKGKNLNVPEGRNVGINKCNNDMIIFIDAGCILDENLFKNLMGILESDGNIDLVGSVYYPVTNNEWAVYFVPKWELIDWWNDFLPSARALAVRKTLVLKAGGFPENYKSGEDTLFDINYRRLSKRWIFNKKAFAYWDAPMEERKALNLSKWYAKGDGETGIGDFKFYDMYMKFKTEGYLPEHPITKAQLEGFIEGRKNRSIIEVDRLKIRSVVVILAGVPFNDIGGGQRGTQIALEFIRNNYKVFFVNIYPSYEEKIVPIYFDIDYTLLELYHINDFDTNDFIERYKAILNKCVVIMEFPHPLFIPIIKEMKKASKKTTIVYDYLDNWDSSLGGSWYSREIEKEIIDRSDVLMASAKTLQDDLKLKTSKRTHLIPNAVNTWLFDPDIAYEAPADMPIDKPVVLYVGAMYGDWYDWETIENALINLSEYRFVFIGNTGGVGIVPTLKAKYDNVLFLGPKPQRDLPPYLKHSEVCIIPFKANHHITKYVNPLKVYEYLAMLRPVVATDMEEIRGIPGVLVSNGHHDFIKNIRSATDSKLDRKEIYDYIDRNNWKSRINNIVKILDNHR